MAKARKKAPELTTTQAMNRIFGRGAAKRLREVVKAADAKKGQRKPKKTDAQ
jgi:hypothetical protein